MTLTSTLDPAIRHTVVHHSSTSTYIPNFIQIEETFCGRTDGRTDVRTDGHFPPLILLGRLLEVDLKTSSYCWCFFQLLLNGLTFCNHFEAQVPGRSTRRNYILRENLDNARLFTCQVASLVPNQRSEGMIWLRTNDCRKYTKVTIQWVSKTPTLVFQCCFQHIHFDSFSQLGFKP